MLTFVILSKIKTVKTTVNEIIISDSGYSCGTGDNFVNQKIEMEVDVVDMEAYAIAKACLNQHVDFKCFKYISDKADEGADLDWLANIADGEEHFIKIFQSATGGG